MPPEDDADENKQRERDAASKVVRDQLDAIYENRSRIITPGREHAPINPRHHQRHQPQPGQQHHHQHEHQAQQQQHHHQQHQTQQQAHGEHWKQYHSQWQDYYQKYYERYYVGKLHEAIVSEEEKRKTPEEKEAAKTAELKQKIIDNAKQSAKKAKKIRHFIPVISALVVVLVVAFLQYNQVLFANVQAYVSPGAIDPQNIIIDPALSTRVGPEPRLIIPKINVDVPVIYGVGPDYNSQMAAMQKGVAHFAIPGANSVPGQKGNTVMSGHSSNDLFDPGDYKFIFAQLDKLEKGDTIFVNYKSTRYTYTVSKKRIVQPSDVQALLGNDDEPYLTLITCTPLGTALNRLLITADQIAPDPAGASAASGESGGDSTDMPGNAPTLLEKLFGAR